MSEQNKMDAERAAFEREDRYLVIKYSDLNKVSPEYRLPFKEYLGDVLAEVPHREFVVVESDWPEYEKVWQMIEARMTGASLPVGVPDGESIRRAAVAAATEVWGDGEYECTEADDLFYQAFVRILLNQAPATPAVKESLSVAQAAPVPYAAIRKLLSNWDGLGSGDSPNVDAVREWLNGTPTVKAEQVQCSTCNDTSMIGDLPIECPDCCHDEAPSLPAAGAVGVGCLAGQVCGGDAEHNTVNIKLDQPAPWYSLRIGTRLHLSAQQSAPERVSVPVALLRVACSGGNEAWQALEDLRALLASHGRGEA